MAENVFATLTYAELVAPFKIAPCTHYVVGITVEVSAELQYCNWVNTFDSLVETNELPSAELE
jgi:hypothetical protein